MGLFGLDQAAAEYVAIAGRSALQTFETTTGSAMQFLEANPVVVVVLIVLAAVLFWMTRPKKV